MPVRPGAPIGVEDDGIERGLVFACFQADIERQFEFVQSQWFADGNAFGLGADKDPLLGDHQGRDKMTVNGARPRSPRPCAGSSRCGVAGTSSSPGSPP